ncbi:hypothetical protein OG905_38585 [Streptomyces sp. NBC_00322]|uniref:hypothetical protein n=1 Tax=Streptomyces sp. NBC_00322 TaxID=2975712 RepID=UPI002E298620|nr:hypothetical protein [Streptomyces sp. NBC_00322]
MTDQTARRAPDRVANSSLLVHTEGVDDRGVVQHELIDLRLSPGHWGAFGRSLTGRWKSRITLTGQGILRYQWFMPEPITLAAISLAGIPVVATFLLDRVGSVLDRRRGERNFPIVREPSPQQRDELEELHGTLSGVITRPAAEVRGDADALAAMERARTLLEHLHDRQIDFEGEKRAPSKYRIRAVVEVEELRDGAVGVRLGEVRSSASIDSQVKAKSADGPVTGVQIDSLE